MSLQDNPIDAVAITPSDTDDFARGLCRGIYVGVSGDVVAIMKSGAVTFKAVPVGVLNIRCTRINSTSTTATNMLALY